MVNITAIRKSNAQYAASGPSGLVCVFAGATAGIGYATLQATATLLNNSTFYVLGRSRSRFEGKLDHLRNIAPSCRFVFIETDVSLISGIDDACKQIRAAEEKVDSVCMSCGGIPFQGAVYTQEGLETCFALSYYSRLRLVSNLLPLLKRSGRPRVLSILNGTKEKRIDESDIGLTKNWGMAAVVNHSTLLTSLTFDYLAENDDQKRITFIHSTPGLVQTDIARAVGPSNDRNGWWHSVLASALQTVMGWVIRFFGAPVEVAGQKNAYLLTSESFGAGSCRVDKNCEIVSDNGVLRGYLERGWAEKAWEHTQSTWENALVGRSDI